MLEVTQFSRYLNKDETEKIFAAPVCEEDAEIIKKHWQRKDDTQEIETGDYIILKGNGDIGVFKKDAFEEEWHIAPKMSPVMVSL